MIAFLVPCLIGCGKKEAQYLKEKEKEEKLREKSPQPRRDRLGVSTGSGTESTSPRASGASPLDPPSPRAQSGALSNSKSPNAVKKLQTSIPRTSRRKSSDQLTLEADMVQIEVNSVVLPATPLMSPQRKLSTQPRRLSRVNPRDVKRLYEGAACVVLLLCSHLSFSLLFRANFWSSPGSSNVYWV